MERVVEIRACSIIGSGVFDERLPCLRECVFLIELVSVTIITIWPRLRLVGIRRTAMLYCRMCSGPSTLARPLAAVAWFVSISCTRPTFVVVDARRVTGCLRLVTYSRMFRDGIFAWYIGTWSSRTFVNRLVS